jgi:hypothetical protein
MSDTHGCKHDPKATLILQVGTRQWISLCSPLLHMAAAAPTPHSKGGNPAAWRTASAKQRTAVSRHLYSIVTSPQATATGVRRRRRRAGARGGDHPCTECDSNWAPAGSQAPARAGRKSGAAHDVGSPIYNVYKLHLLKSGGPSTGGISPACSNFINILYLSHA